MTHACVLLKMLELFILAFICETRLLQMCDMTHWHDTCLHFSGSVGILFPAFIYDFHWYVRNESLIWATWLIDRTHACIFAGSVATVYHWIHMWDCLHWIHMWDIKDSLICATWLIHMSQAWIFLEALEYSALHSHMILTDLCEMPHWHDSCLHFSGSVWILIPRIHVWFLLICAKYWDNWCLLFSGSVGIVLPLVPWSLQWCAILARCARTGLSSSLCMLQFPLCPLHFFLH